MILFVLLALGFMILLLMYIGHFVEKIYGELKRGRRL